MLDIKNINKGLFIHKGLIASHKKNEVEENVLTERKSNLILKSYMMRKEKYCHKEEERYIDVPKISIDQLTFRSHTARSTDSRHLSSRISITSVLKA